MPRSSKQRLCHLLRDVCLVALLGGVYALICFHFGVGLPCPFYLFTGLQCPGCGVSRLCLSLLRLDFAGAWAANPAILLLLPFGVLLAVRLAVRYVRNGTRRLTKAETVLVYAACICLLIFGVLRNL